MQTLHTSNTIDTATTPLSELLSGWRKMVETDLKGAAFEKKLVTPTPEGVALQPLYTRADVAHLTHLATAPGQAPYVRGYTAGGYGTRPWRVAQELSEQSPAAFNTALHANLVHGQDAVVIESPALLASVAALREALAGVDLSAVPVHIAAGANALASAAVYLTLAAERRCEWARLSGGITADPLNAWAIDSTVPLGIERELDALAGWTRWAANHAPNLRTIGINGRAWSDTGGTAVHELAFALAAGAEYIRELNDRGVAVETAVHRMAFQFAIGPQFFTEIAKFRAWRLLWTRVIAAFGAKPNVATLSHVHAATGVVNKTLLDPHVNMLRATTEALSAVLGGCDSLHIAPFDEVTGATTEFSRRIARNVHVLLAEEFGFAQTADPAGGSWYVEKLTDELARKAWDLFQKIAAEGGFARALRDGIPQTLVSEAAMEKADGVGKRRMALIGTNVFPNLKEKPLTAVSAAAPAHEVPSVSMPKLSTAAAWPERFESALAAARAGATSDQLAKLAGAKTRRAEPIATISPFRASAGFEFLRSAANAYALAHGHPPRVFLAKMGPPLQHKARADFAMGFFATGGFEVLAKQTFASASEAAEAAAASGAPIAVLCSTDETYPELAPAFAAAAKAARTDLRIVLAGLPGEQAVVAAFRDAGIDEFIHLRANVHAMLAKFLKQLGALA